MQCRLQLFTQDNLNRFLYDRVGEQRVGAMLKLPNEHWEHHLKHSDIRYVVLGIPEDIGVRANLGIGGTQTAWNEFLKSFVNTQYNQFIQAENILLLGHFVIENSENATIEQLREHTEIIDEAVFPIIQKIVNAGKIPIAIGGGHNNALPIIKGTYLGLQKTINVVNLDAHADFREMEGRHSGNGFKYAYHQHYLAKYAVLAMQEAYNNQSMISAFATDENLQAIYWEDIFLRQNISWEQAIANSLLFVQGNDYGVELDIDAIENVLSSALSPIGVSVQQAMKYIYDSAANVNVRYLHLPEGVAKRADGLSNTTIGKLLTGMVLAFIKSRESIMLMK